VRPNLKEYKNIDDIKRKEQKYLIDIEKHIILPAKWITGIISLGFIWLINYHVPIDLFEDFFDPIFYLALALYLGTNVAFTWMFFSSYLNIHKDRVVRSIYLSLMADILFVTALIYFAAGIESGLYLLYCVLLIRVAIVFSSLRLQLITSIFIGMLYIISIYFPSMEGLSVKGSIVKIVLLVAVGLCCFGVRALLSMKRQELINLVEALNRAQKQLVNSARLAVMGPLSASVAHELKNPLAIISNSLFFIEKHWPADKNKDIEKNFAIIKDETSKANNIINDMLSESKRLKSERIEIKTLLEQMVTSIKKQFSEKKIQINMFFKQKSLWLSGDKNELKIAFNNLGVNACEAISGGGTIEITTELIKSEDVETIKNREMGIKDYVKIIVSDTGKGIPEKHLKDIFLPFFSLKEKGSGLGLFVAYNTIQKHNGDIEVKSTPNKGSSFIVYLPTEKTTG
jgi:signal transduction histidine kinase